MCFHYYLYPVRISKWNQECAIISHWILATVYRWTVLQPAINHPHSRCPFSCSPKDGKDDAVRGFVDSFAGHLASEHVIVMSDYGCSGCKSLLFESTLSKNGSDTTLIITNINRTSNYSAYLEEGYTNLLLDTKDLALERKVWLLYPAQKEQPKKISVAIVA